ncbi:21891_t:CDS:2, partial [Gigaspora margarita]
QNQHNQKASLIAQTSVSPIFEPEVDVSVSSVSFTSHTFNSKDTISKDDKSLLEIEDFFNNEANDKDIAVFDDEGYYFNTNTGEAYTKSKYRYSIRVY